MSYFADSAWDYLAEKVDRLQKEGTAGRRLLVIVPSLPEPTMLTLAETFTSRCIPDSRLELTIKIAQVVLKDWSSQGIAKANHHAWVDDRGNLTYYRNLPAKAGKTNLIVLCGADRITDAGSLADFHCCDLAVVWNVEMKGSFRTWVGEKLRSIGLDNVDIAELREFDRLLLPLLEHGKADLLSIGEWLAALDLSPADTARDALKIMLGRFDFFQLPKFTGFHLIEP